MNEPITSFYSVTDTDGMVHIATSRDRRTICNLNAASMSDNSGLPPNPDLVLLCSDCYPE